MICLYILDLEGNIIEANRAALELFKYSREDLGKINLRDIIVEEYVETAFENLRKIIETGKPIQKPYEFLCKTKDGKLVWLEVKSRPIIKRGKVVAIQGIARDITERKETEELFKTLAEKSLVGIYLIQDGVFKYVNPKLAELWGYKVEEIVGRSPLEFIHPEDRDLVEKNLRLRIKGKIDAVKYKFKVIRKDGEVRTNEVFGSRVFYKGKPAVIGTLIDVTEQERYLEKLKEYKRFYENAQDLFFILDEKGRFIDLNPKFAEIVGYEINELIGQTSKKLVHPEDFDRLREFFTAVINGEVRRDEFRAITKDGEILWFEILEWPIFEKGKLVKVEGIAREITQRKILEEKLRESEEKFRKIFENTPNIVAIIDPKGRFIEANPSMIKSLGVNPIGKTISDVLPEEIAKRRFGYFKRALKENKAITFQDTRNKKHFINTVIPIELGGKKHLLLIARDVSELVRLNRLLRAMNSINKLIAHIRDKQTLLKRVCELLSSLKEYLAVTINLFEGGELRPVAAAGASQEFLNKLKNCKLLKEFTRSEIVICDKKCPECEIKDEIKQAFALPMISEGKIMGVITVHSTSETISDEEIDLLQTFAKDLAFAIKSIELEKLKEKAYQQIEHNIEQFATLIDRIRNPLAAIQALAELNLDEKTAKKIIEQIERINEVIKELDKGWMESEKIKNFLRKTEHASSRSL